MLTSFDWLRRSRNGQELLGTLIYLSENSGFPAENTEIGPPLSALRSPCQRCWIYPPQGGDVLCRTCAEILTSGQGRSRLSRHSIVIWGVVDRLPQSLQHSAGGRSPHVLGAYIHDERRFLAMMLRRDLKPWLQEMVIHHGTDLRGGLQIFPTMGPKPTLVMGDILCWAVHHEAYREKDRLCVRFYSSPSQVIMPHKRDRRGLLNFEISEFLGLLEMAEVFRLLLHPNEQRELFELLALKNPEEKQFYWGRFLGFLDQQAKDMLTAWGIRNWPQNRVQLLYELVRYVYVDFSRPR